MRYLLILITCVFIVASIAAYDSRPFKLAYSTKQAAEIYAAPQGDTWCGRNVNLVVHLGPESPLKGSAAKSFFQKVGAVLTKECSKATAATIIVMQGHYSYEYSLAVYKADNWTPKTSGLTPKQAKALFNYYSTIAAFSLADVLNLKSTKEVRWGTGGISTLLLFVLLIAPRRPKKTASLLDDESPQHDQSSVSEPIDDHNDTKEEELESQEDTSADFLVYHTQFSQRYNKALDTPFAYNDPVQAGDHGEARVLQEIANIGGGIVYWGLGLSNRRKKCEMDILVVAPHGLLHVEVKNLSGTWESGQFFDESRNCKIHTWRRQEDGKILSKSPVSQADRARDMLGKTVDDLCRTLLPVHSVVVVSNDRFKFTGGVDDGVTVMDLDEFTTFYQDFVHGSLARLQAAKKGIIGALVEYIAGFGQKPSFYDVRMFEHECIGSITETPLTPGLFEDSLMMYLNRCWGLDFRIPKHDHIWFGDKDDMDPQKNDYSPSK